MARWICAAFTCVAALASGCGQADPYFIPGTGTLPDCSDPPDTSVAGRWFDQGTVTVQTAGCTDLSVGEELVVCALDWVITQENGAVSITVDEEYRIEGRHCGDQLHLRGGWWLPVQDELGHCNYEDEDAAEVVIDAEGNALTVAEGAMSGTLTVRQACEATYDVVLTRL